MPCTEWLEQISLGNDSKSFSFVLFSYKGLSQDYVKSVTPVEPPPPPPPVWKRSPAEWERDRIELAKLDYGKHALRYQEVPPYFETAQGLLSKALLAFPIMMTHVKISLIDRSSVSDWFKSRS